MSTIIRYVRLDGNSTTIEYEFSIPTIAVGQGFVVRLPSDGDGIEITDAQVTEVWHEIDENQNLVTYVEVSEGSFGNPFADKVSGNMLAIFGAIGEPSEDPDAEAFRQAAIMAAARVAGVVLPIDDSQEPI